MISNIVVNFYVISNLSINFYLYSFGLQPGQAVSTMSALSFNESPIQLFTDIIQHMEYAINTHKCLKINRNVISNILWKVP